MGLNIFVKIQNVTNLNLSHINRLKNLIIQELKPLIDRDYVLLDVPDYDNIGDNLIWEGELEFLKEVPHRKLYEASYLFFQQKKIPGHSIILFQGGGNFGDIYTKTQKERLKIISENRDKKIIILPQTIHYQNIENLKKDAEIIRAHPDLIFCVRDRVSFDLVQKHFPNVFPKLLPDMAFCIDPKRFDLPSTAHKTLLMKRNDSELGKIPFINGSFDTLDWPTFNLSKEERWKKIGQQRRIDKMANTFQKLPIFNTLVDSRYGLKSSQGKEKYIRTGIEFFSQYETIYTTRLHGLILGILMGRNMKVLDNSYGKLTNFYKEWLVDFENVELVYKN